MENYTKKLETVFKIVVLLCIFIVGVFLFLLYRKVSKLGKLPTPQAVKDTQNIDVCGEECKSQISKEVSKAIATVSGTTKEEIVYQPAPASGQNKATTYIPFSGPITTTSTGWVDAPGTDVYIDLAGDYGKVSGVAWDAFLKVAHGNGQASARLYDATHGIGVNGSEVSTNSPTSVQVSSGNMSLWAGRNLYRVQIKSLNSFEVTFFSGRIKITY